MATRSIDLMQLQAMLADIDVPDAAIRPFLVESEDESTPLCPVVKINPTKVEPGPLEGAVAMASLNGVARWRRQQRYRRKVGAWQGLRIVSEGDSWFEYPFLLDDVIDQLWDAYAILSLDAAGDLLSDMVRQDELVAAVVQERPHVVLLSGGGNDILGGARLAKMLPPFEPGRPPEAYLGAAFDANLRQVMADYDTMVARVASVAPGTPMICHGYDRAIPAAGRWLGRPLAAIGIADPALQRRIVACIVDRFNAELDRLAQRHGTVRRVDCRGRVADDQWHDELHPTNAGFHTVAELFAAAIAQATNTQPAMLESAPGPERAEVESTLAARSAGDIALALRTTYSESVLLREIGRRKMLAASGDVAAGTDGEPLLVHRTSVENVYPDQLALGRQLAAGAAQVLAASGARMDDGAARGAVVERMAAALSGHDGLPAPATLLLAAVLAA